VGGWIEGRINCHDIMEQVHVNFLTGSIFKFYTVINFGSKDGLYSVRYLPLEKGRVTS